MGLADRAGPGGEGQMKLVLDLVEGRHAVTGVVVPDLVHQTRPAIEGHEVGSQGRRQ